MTEYTIGTCALCSGSGLRNDDALCPTCDGSGGRVPLGEPTEATEAVEAAEAAPEPEAVEASSEFEEAADEAETPAGGI